ncbi:hypothetical protein KA005_62950 [bacterium]|nr:hypothetical protein [bacterium]
MKKFSTLIVALTIAVFTLTSAQVFAQVNQGGNRTPNNSGATQRRGMGVGTHANYADANGDGICDNRGSRSGERQRDGRGLRNGSGSRNGSGRGRASGKNRR